VFVIYVILGILYESFIHPITILSGLPAAALGALLTLNVFGKDLNVIAIIGIVMLIGIVKKNAIMMIDVALEKRREGATPETAIHEAPESAHAVFSQLTEHGVRIALDDFGTGYSSLGHLRRIPADALKIDRAFVNGLENEEGDSAIVTAVITMAHALGMITVGEGIESEVQYNHLRALGCDQGQGYLFAEPVPASAFEILHLDTASPPGEHE